MQSLESTATFFDDPAQQRDMELVAAARAGSKAAFSELYNGYARVLYRRVLSITRNHEDAEDALQEAMLHAYAALDTFEGRSRLNSWLTRIAINSALMILRRRRTRAEVSFEPLLPGEDEASEFEVKDCRPDPEQVYEMAERRRSVLRSIETLKPALRAVLQFQVSQGLSMHEIAQTLDVSVATVKARLHRARKRLTERDLNHLRPARRSTRVHHGEGPRKHALEGSHA
jgi:RNA polymerase sigma-70 factor, ECF subfamily